MRIFIFRKIINDILLYIYYINFKIYTKKYKLILNHFINNVIFFTLRFYNDHFLEKNAMGKLIHKYYFV